MRKTFITNLKLKGFKSFNNHTNLQFGPGFNCIAGANGSGKSNVLDALCFVLGRLSTKSIRADNYGDLVYTKNGKKSNGGFVSITFDNSSGIFGINDKKVELVREITKEGKTKYWLNGRRATRTQVLELLDLSQIRPEGHNIILQGDISSFITMYPKDKRKLIEDIAGIGSYERKKESALKELSKVEVKLRDVQIVMNEKKVYLNSLEDDKKTAEQYQSYSSEEKYAKATELNLKLNSSRSKKQNISSRLEKVENMRRSFTKIIDESTKKIDILSDKIETIEKQIEKKGGEDQLELQKDIENLRIDIENSKNLVSSSKNEIRRIEERKKQLVKSLSDIEGKMKMENSDMKELRSKLRIIENSEHSIKKELGISNLSANDLEKNLDNKDNEVDALKTRKIEVVAEQVKLKSVLEIMSIKSESLKNKLIEIIDIEKRINQTKSKKDRYKEILIEINSLSDRDSEIFNEIKELRKGMLDKESSLTKLKMELNSSHELLMRDRAIGAILKNKKKLGEIYGTVAQLGEVDGTYSKALKISAGSRMKNIVVKDEKVAIKCLNYLREKRLGIATFLPLNKIETSTKIRIPNVPGVIGLANELVSCDPNFKNIFSNIFRNTIVVKSTETAKSVGIGKYNMVNLEGDTFSRGGAISGGYRRDSGISFTQKQSDDKLEELNKEVDKLRNNSSDLEKERNNIDKELINLRKLKIEIESGLGSLYTPDESSTELKNKIDTLSSEQRAIISNLRNLDKEQLTSKDKLNKSIVERNFLKSKLRELQFGKKKKELDRLESNHRDLNGQIATITSTIENVLAPEQENISKVVSELNREKNEFNIQIEREGGNVEELSVKLKNREQAEKEFYGQLKQLFSEKGKLSDLVKKEQGKMKEIELESSGENEEYNSLNISKAKIDSELSAIREEIEPYTTLKTLPYLKTIQAAKQKQAEIRKRISSLGNVNMKALEIYGEIKTEWDKLNWRVNKLDTERQSIADVINEIETKKKNVFMHTFNKISNNFSKIYGNITDNVVSGKIILENESNPFEGGVVIKVVKPGTNSLTSLSGGEKAMVALSFLFAIAEFNPSPFYLLDEIDAPLDGVNVIKIAELLKEYADKSQIIIISHKESVMSSADILHGIWMNKKHGESYISSMKVK